MKTKSAGIIDEYYYLLEDLLWPQALPLGYDISLWCAAEPP